MEHNILCINSGSSSMKFAMYFLDTTEKLIAEVAVEQIGLSGGWLWLKDGQGKRLADSYADFSDHKAAVKAMFTTVMDEQHLPAPDGVGHRLAHGGP